jgi:hypothetical protein
MVCESRRYSRPNTFYQDAGSLLIYSGVSWTRKLGGGSSEGGVIGVDSEGDGEEGLAQGDVSEGGVGSVGGVGGKGDDEGGMQKRGESYHSSSSPSPLNSSNSQRCFAAFLVRLEGEGEVDSECSTRGADGAGSGSGAGLIRRGSLAADPAAGSSELVLTALVATKSQQQRQ